MSPDHYLLGFLWILFCFLHSLFASLWIKKRIGAKKYYRLAYSLFSAGFLILLAFYQLSVSSILVFYPGPAGFIAGVLMLLAGIIVMHACIKENLKRAGGFRWLVKNDGAGTLLQSGIHGRVRHPIYLGTFLVIWGWWIITPWLSQFIMNMIITAYTLIAIRFEEKKLGIEFGPDYLEYKKRTPMILPGIRFFQWLIFMR